MTIQLARRTAVTAVLAGIAATAAPLTAQEGWEWEPGEGYHEEEWYDPSDWFDDDDTIDYEYDWNDYGWDSDYYDWGYYYDTYDPYGYGYYDYWYDGYDHWSDYDYYDRPYWDDYGAYDWSDDDYVYLEDDDWVWNSQSNRWMRWSEMRSDLRGQDMRGQDMRGQRGTRNQQGTQRQQRQGRQPRQDGGQGQSQQETFRGRVDSFSTVNLKGQRDAHTVVRVRLQDGETRLVNFGPRNQLRRLDVQQGDQIVVQGRPGHISGRPVLMATRIKSGGQTARIQRGQTQRDSGQPGRGTTTVRGGVERWTKMQLGEGDRREHLFVRLRLANDRSAIVNFGPNVEMSDLDLQQGEQLFVRGPTRQINGRTVVFASEARVGQERLDLQWSPARRQQRGSGM